MERKYSNFCKPITVGRTTSRNRMFSAPMGGTDITNDGCIGVKSTAFYELRAKGGGLAGCECAIHLGKEGKKVHLVKMLYTGAITLLWTFKVNKGEKIC